MADRRIADLDEATVLTSGDLFVLSQSNQAKKATWTRILTYLANALDGHGGISSIAKVSSSNNVDTYRITFADSTATTFTVTNGKEISSVVQYWAVSDSNVTAPSTWQTTMQTMTVTDRYLWSYTRYNYNDSTYDDTTPSVIGVYGDTGDDWYVHIKYAQSMPSADSDMVDYPNDWMGVYSGTAENPPTTYTSYEWFQIKGEKGDTGNAILSINRTGQSGLIDTYTISFSNNTSTTFQVRNGSNITGIAKTGTSGLVDTYTVSLSDGTSTTFTVTNAKSISSITPVDVTRAAGHTDTYRINYNDGDTFEFQIYNGVNGTGAVSTVDGITSSNQEVTLLTLGTGAPTPARAGAGVTVDSSMSTTSTNPVQNAVLTAIIGTVTMSTTAQTLKGAVNGLKTSIETVASSMKHVKASNIDVAISAWVTDPEGISSDFPLRAPVTVTGATAAMFPEVVFSITDAMSGNFAPIAKCGDGVVYIYAAETPESIITVQSVLAVL